jgi:hypothetical protein
MTLKPERVDPEGPETRQSIAKRLLLAQCLILRLCRVDRRSWEVNMPRNQRQAQSMASRKVQTQMYSGGWGRTNACMMMTTLPRVALPTR